MSARNVNDGSQGGHSFLDEHRAVQAGSAVYHEVWVNGTFTNRRFTSLVAAQRYADALGGEVRQTT